MNEPATRGYGIRIRIEFVDLLRNKLREVEIKSWEPEVEPGIADDHMKMIVDAVIPLVGSGEIEVIDWHGHG